MWKAQGLHVPFAWPMEPTEDPASGRSQEGTPCGGGGMKAWATKQGARVVGGGAFCGPRDRSSTVKLGGNICMGTCTM
eukprot:Skav224610  [mRNA]  locus=scaffold3477:127689:135520:+ [translate_table: standard]